MQVVDRVAKSQTKSDMLTELLLFILNILIATFVLRFAWNRSLVKHITIFKPIETMLDAFILALSLSIVRA
jgi:predicted AAA+ superfamily ATPase